MEFNYNTYTILRVVHPAPGNRNRQLATGTWQPEPGNRQLATGTWHLLPKPNTQLHTRIRPPHDGFDNVVNDPGHERLANIVLVMNDLIATA